jgi:hypothetical protein
MVYVILLSAVVIPGALMICSLLIWRAWHARDKRRSPLTVKVRNLPGEHLRKEISKHDDAYDEAAMAALSLGPIVLSAWLLARFNRVIRDWSLVQFGLGDLLLLLTSLMLFGWAVHRMFFHAGQRRAYRQGLEAELAVAQCLTPLIAEGGFVFHDFPANGFNIDHIVVGRSAVFAIETKSRRKPAAKGQESAQVKYDGSHLRFPDFVDTKCVEQARIQSDWLSKFLASGVGEPVKVLPLLALPGWYVDDQDAPSRPAVMVNNCHNPMFMAGDRFGLPMTDAFRKRIAHVLIERYPPFEAA